MWSSCFFFQKYYILVNKATGPENGRPRRENNRLWYLCVFLTFIDRPWPLPWILQGFDNQIGQTTHSLGNVSFKSLLQQKKEEERGIRENKKESIVGCSRSSLDAIKTITSMPLSFLIPRGSLTQAHSPSRGCLIEFRNLHGEKCTVIFTNLWWNFSILIMNWSNKLWYY